MVKKRRETHEVGWNGWVQASAVDEVLGRILASREVESGALRFRGLDLDARVALLTLALDFHPAIPHEQRYLLVHKAVRDAFKNPEVPRGRFLEAVRVATNAYVAEPLREFHVVGMLTIVAPKAPLRRKFHGVSIEILADRPAWAPPPRFRVLKPIERDYAVLVARCNARNAGDAFSLAVDSVDLLRATWNLALNYRRSSRNSGGLRPQNRVYWGSAFSVYDDAGVEIESLHDDDHPPPLSVKSVFEEKALVRTERWVRSRLRDSRHRDYLREMLLRYVRTFDEKDPNQALLRIWNLLEFLTGSPKTYDVLIERASYFFVEREQIKFELECARRLRNEKTHDAPRDTPHSMAESLVAVLKGLVDVICHHHLTSIGDHATLEECWQVLEASHRPESTGAMLERAKQNLRVARQAHALAHRLNQSLTDSTT